MTTEIQLPAAELKEALAGFNKIIGKTTLPVFWHVRLTKHENGPVHLQAANLDEFATFTFPNESSSAPIDLLIPFDQLLKVGKSCGKKENVFIRQKSDAAFIAYPLCSQIVEQSITKMDLTEWPRVPSIANDEPVIVGETFKSALKAALDCSSQDGSRQVLQTAFLDVSDRNAHYIVGADGRQLFAANSFAFDLKDSLMVPHRPFLIWKGFMEDGDWKLSIKGPAKEDDVGWINIQSNRWNLITKQIDGKYPNWKQVIPKADTKEATVLLNNEAVELLMNVVPKLPGDDDVNQPVRVVITDDKELILQAEGKNGESPVTIRVPGANVQGNPVTILVNRNYLLKALKWGLFELELYPTEMPILIFKSEGTRLVVAGLRDDNAPQTTQSPQPKTNPPIQASSPETKEQPKEESPSMKTVNRIEQVQTTQPTIQPEQPTPAFKQATEQVEKIKETLKGVVSDLNDLLKTLAQAQKEKRTTEKEIEAIRESLQSLQRIKI